MLSRHVCESWSSPTRPLDHYTLKSQPLVARWPGLQITLCSELQYIFTNVQEHRPRAKLI